MGRPDAILEARAQRLGGGVGVLAGLRRGRMEGVSLKHRERQRNTLASFSRCAKNYFCPLIGGTELTANGQGSLGTASRRCQHLGPPGKVQEADLRANRSGIWKEILYLI